MKEKFNKKEIRVISKKVLDKIIKMKSKNARIVALSGDLGAGKTTLTQNIALKLGIKNSIISPTFVIMKSYDIKQSSVYYKYFKNLIHIDAYRLDSGDELLKIGWDEIVNNKDNLIVLEWPEKVESCLNDNILKIKLHHIDENTRSFEF